MNRAPLRLAVAQPVPHDDDLAASVEAHAALVAASGARVIVFPELSLTGYRFDAADLVPSDAVLAALVSACADAGALALVGAPVGGTIAVLTVDGVGANVVYRKVWVDVSEAGRFSPGPGPVVIEVDGWRLGLAVCRDTRFPEHDEATAALGMDVYVAGVVHHAHEAPVTEERALRVVADRGVWAATASHAGATGEGFAETAGGSGIWSPDGSCVARAGGEPGQVVTATLVATVGA